MDLSNFNPQQIEAISHREGPAIVIASAGAGKTRVVTERIVSLINNDVDPSEIFACTFTKKAALEMQERLVNSIGKTGEAVRVSTLHSFCYQVLKSYYSQGGRNQKIQLVHNGQLWIFLSKLMKDNKTRIKDIKQFLMQVSHTKLNCISVKDYFDKHLSSAEKDPNFPLDHTNHEKLCFFFMYKEYERFLQKNEAIDFTDMLFKVYQIFYNPENEKFVQRVKNRIRYLAVDEFQDTNPISFSIYKKLVEDHKNIMVVCDPRQAIYSFQGADNTILNTFISEYNPKILELPINYRSDVGIIEKANLLISKDAVLGKLAPSQAFINSGSVIKKIKSDCELFEAHQISDAIKEAHSQGYKYNDIAILYRVHSQSLPLIDQLANDKVPYRLFSDYSLFDRKEIKTIFRYIAAIASPDEITKSEFWEIANNPVRYIKKVSFEEIEDAADSSSRYDSFYDALTNASNILDYKQARCVNSLVSDLARGNKLLRSDRNLTTTRLINFILHELGVKAWFEEGDGKNSDMEINGEEDRELNIDVLYAMAEKYPVIEDFIQFVSNITNKKENPEEDRKVRDAVNMMTIHRSKGLEFPVVILAGMCTRTLPYYRSVDEGRLSEERRLAYVGVTRAEEVLYLSSIEGRMGRFRVEASPFLSEMGI